MIDIEKAIVILLFVISFWCLGYIDGFSICFVWWLTMISGWGPGAMAGNGETTCDQTQYDHCGLPACCLVPSHSPASQTAHKLRPKLFTRC